MDPRADRDMSGIGRQPEDRRGTGATVSSNQTVREVMTPEPRSLPSSATVLDAAKLMRENDIGDVVVTENNRICGIVTDRDIVVRVLAEKSNPATVTVGEISSRNPCTISPMATVGEAVQMIRDNAIRRL